MVKMKQPFILGVRNKTNIDSITLACLCSALACLCSALACLCSALACYLTGFFLYQSLETYNKNELPTDTRTHEKRRSTDIEVLYT